MTFEDVLQKVGDFGRCQKFMLLVLGFGLSMRAAHVFIQVFIAAENKHYCQAWMEEDCSLVNITTDECTSLKKDISIPSNLNDDNETVYEQCVKYNVSGHSLQSVLDGVNESSAYLDVVPCDEGWIFEQSSIYPTSIIIDFELVCGNSYLVNIAQSFYFAGSLVSSPFLGLLADIFGRRSTQLLCFVVAILAGIPTSFSFNIWVYMLLRFLVAAAVRGFSLIAMVHVSEMVSASKRIYVPNILYFFFACGHIVLAVLATVFTRWRTLQFIITIPYIPILILFWIFFFFSPQWLITKKMFPEAQAALKKMAKINGKYVEDDFVTAACENDVEKRTSATKEALRDLLHSPVVVFIFINLSFSYFAQSTGYYGLTFSTSILGINPFYSFILFGVVEIPGFITCVVLAQRLGRRWTNFGGLMLSGICCCVLPIIPLGIGRILVATIGKFSNTVSLCTLYTWGPEVCPTVLRSSGLGMFSFSSRLGTVVTPIILILKDFWIDLPILVIGSISIFASIMSLCLPETNGKPLPTNIQDTENLFRRHLVVEDENVSSRSGGDTRRDYTAINDQSATKESSDEQESAVI